VRIFVAATGTAIAFIVARDGSAPWQLVRLAGVAGLTVAMIAALRRRTCPEWVTLAAGLLAVAVGAGIAVPHLAKSGLSPLAAAGLVALVGGLGLVVAGAAELVRRSRRWGRAAVASGLLLVSVVGIYVVGIAVAATNVPRTSVAATTPADIGLRYRDVTFDTADATTLSGWYIPSSNGAAVVLSHGAGSTRSGVLDHAAALARHGYGVLLYDARGHGRSDGRAMDFGWYGDEDVGAAVSFLQGQPDVDDARIAAVGMSMGGEESIGAAAADQRIRAVVAEGATNRTAADSAWLSDAHGWRGTLQEGIEWVLYATVDVLTAADPPVALRDAATAAAPRPMLLIAGGDMPDEGDAGRYIAGAAPDTVELWVVPDAGHTEALATHPEEWEERVTSFLAEALERTPQR
jgi:dienelactone hydrolase